VIKDGHLFLSLMADGGIYETVQALIDRDRTALRASVDVVIRQARPFQSANGEGTSACGRANGLEGA
jgi:hypothetical protein